MTPRELFSSYIQTASNSVAEERELIGATKRGDNNACGALLTQYAPVIKKYAAQAPKSVDREEIQGALMLGFMEAVTAFNEVEHSNLAVILPNHLKRALTTVGVHSCSFTIPARSLSRWLGILKKADGDVWEGARIAPDSGMSRSTFLSIHSALRSTNSLDALLSAGPYVVHALRIQTQEPVGESDGELVGLVFSERGDDNDLNQREAEVLRRVYGWWTYGSMQTDDAVGVEMGLSRATVQRTRQGALEKARRRLGLA